MYVLNFKKYFTFALHLMFVALFFSWFVKHLGKLKPVTESDSIAEMDTLKITLNI